METNTTGTERQNAARTGADAPGIVPDEFTSGQIAGSLTEAITWAAMLHHGQVDKAGEPYILHPLRVMNACKGADERIAAVLHDVVEDCLVEPGEIAFRFGIRVRDAVVALTKRNGEAYADFIQRCAADPVARTVKLADLADNMNLSRLGREPTMEDARRQMKYADAVNVLRTAQWD